MFEGVLVANRGEIAVRICKTLRRMGIRSVVAASIPDRRSLAVRTADDWVLLEGYSASETYLDIDAVIAAAKEKGCEAIHPGYGFLSERADFAERCAAEGIVFVGPPPGVLRAVGDKSSARQLAVANDVPVVPGWDGADDDDTLIHEATRIGFPVMIKARGGGGGRGMREVHEPHALAEALESARREALAAFGDPGLLVEKLVTGAHHVEVQVVADAHGNFVHLGERDCSVQRRRQKLIEETPSPVVDEALRSELTGAALRLARAVGYVNAGTFEFLVGEPAADGRRPFYFLEVNPRLQVEHPVTEMVTGLDLVEWQLRVAAGEELPLRQEDVRFEGHAIEFRVNAEDPWDGFKPSGGRIEGVDWPPSDVCRVDGGYEGGDVVPTQYDSLLAKLVVKGDDRGDALKTALEELPHHDVKGLRTNMALHAAILKQDEFVRGSADVGWLERGLEGLERSARAPREFVAAAALAAMQLKDTPSPFGQGPGMFHLDDRAGLRSVRVSWRSKTEASVQVDGEEGIDCRLIRRLGDQLWVDVPGVSACIGVLRSGRTFSAWLEEGTATESWLLTIVPPPALPRRAHDAAGGATAVVAPLAGTIASVRVTEGDGVEAGDPLVTLDAMKMEHRITATVGGTVSGVRVGVGDVVREGDLLVELS